MKEKEIIDYEQEYYNLLYENRKYKRKIKELEEEIYILKKYKDVNIKKVLLEQISKYKRE
jgi:hypothetical protein|nr:MAG TPA: hypothetical protein [Caudoviricetes sp.]